MFIKKNLKEKKSMDANVNHPKHYNEYPIEVIEMMMAIWGRDKVKDFCILNAFKYRMRMGLKGNPEEDRLKEKWYLNKAEELKDKPLLF